MRSVTPIKKLVTTPSALRKREKSEFFDVLTSFVTLLTARVIRFS